MGVFSAVIAVMSLVAIVLYAEDKRRARKKQWRIKESLLLSVGFFGGALGAILAMKLFRHKTKHWYFWAVNIIGFIAHIALAIIIILK